jgi:hypothetical protein
MIHYAYVCVFWLLASAALGRWAQPGIHDPKSFLLGIPLGVESALLLLTFAAAPLVLAVGYARGSLRSHVVAYATCLVLSILLFRLNIQQMTTWIAD